MTKIQNILEILIPKKKTDIQMISKDCVECSEAESASYSLKSICYIIPSTEWTLQKNLTFEPNFILL